MKQWTIIYRPHYSAWFGKCGEELQDEILAHLEVLKTVGPNLGRPRVDHIKNVPLADQEFSLHLQDMQKEKKKDKEKKR
jgi:hypothetical protein